MEYPSKKRTTGPKNDAMQHIAEVDKQILEQYDAPAISLSDVKYLKHLRRGYVQTIEAKD